MFIPAFWARAKGQATTPDQRELELVAWGWSASSDAEAQTNAGNRLARVLDRVRRGEPLPHKYTYGDRPIREERLEELDGPDGEPLLVVTRNVYGSLVLNAARALFIDVDEPRRRRSGGLLGMLFGRKAPEPPSPTLDRIRHALRELGAGSFRVYRTAAGYRVLGVDREYAPESSDTLDIMSRVGSDPNYIQLCKVQKSFRARLTPKPWRCGTPNPPGQFPRTDPFIEARFRDWLPGYEAACEGHATCALLETIGDAPVADAVRPVLQLHDRMTRADSGLALA